MPAAGRGATATARAKAKALAPCDAVGGPGWCGLAGDAVNPPPGSGPAAGGCAFGRLRSSASQAKRPHPWGLGSRIHAADTPASPHRPGLDRFMRQSGWQRQKQERFLVSGKKWRAEHGLGSTRSAQPSCFCFCFCSSFFSSVGGRTRKLSEVGRVGWAGVSAPWMARLSPQGRVYGVPCPAHPPGQAQLCSRASSTLPTLRPPTRGCAVRRNLRRRRRLLPKQADRQPTHHQHAQPQQRPQQPRLPIVLRLQCRITSQRLRAALQPRQRRLP